MPMLDCLFSGISAFRYLLMIFQHHIARITQSGWTWTYAFLFTFVKLFVKCWNAGLSGIRSVQFRNEQMPMPEPVRYRNKGTQSGAGILRYWTEIPDAVAVAIGLGADAQLCTVHIS